MYSIVFIYKDIQVIWFSPSVASSYDNIGLVIRNSISFLEDLVSFEKTLESAKNSNMFSST